METDAVDAVTSDREEPRLAALYRAHATEAARLAYLLTGSRAVAEDLVQDAFLRIAGRFGHLRDESAFVPYLRKSIVNLARMHFRKQGSHRAWLSRQAPAPAVQPPDVEERRAVVDALLSLPERQRAALVLRYYADLSEAQTADALGCRIGTVKSLAFRGLAALREIVRGEHE